MGQAQVPPDADTTAMNAAGGSPGPLRGRRVTGRSLTLLRRLHFEDGLALVCAAIRADVMREPHRAALRAAHDVGGGQGVVGAPAVAAALGMLTFWLRWH